MEYNDEQILNLQDYEKMAKAYADTLKNKGFIFVKVNDEKEAVLLDEILDCMSQIKSCLFIMGGFLNTSQLYSLNERQIKKLSVLFDYDKPLKQFKMKYDKTSCFLKFIGLESQLIRDLLQLCEYSNFESELKKIIDARLATMASIFING